VEWILATVGGLVFIAVITSTLVIVARDGHRRVPYDPDYDTRFGAGDR
jgi:hypothetical protein